MSLANVFVLLVYRKVVLVVAKEVCVLLFGFWTIKMSSIVCGMSWCGSSSSFRPRFFVVRRRRRQQNLSQYVAHQQQASRSAQQEGMCRGSAIMIVQRPAAGPALDEIIRIRATSIKYVRSEEGFSERTKPETIAQRRYHGIEDVIFIPILAILIPILERTLF